jgi:hypothetical protein
MPSCGCMEPDPAFDEAIKEFDRIDPEELLRATR